jgi:hypothetical protein
MFFFNGGSSVLRNARGHFIYPCPHFLDSINNKKHRDARRGVCILRLASFSLAFILHLLSFKKTAGMCQPFFSSKILPIRQPGISIHILRDAVRGFAFPRLSLSASPLRFSSVTVLMVSRRMQPCFRCVEPTENAEKICFAGESLCCCDAQTLTDGKSARALRFSRLALHPAKRISHFSK